jgi:hypothetical protein
MRIMHKNSEWNILLLNFLIVQISINYIDGVVISMLVSKVVDRGVETRFDQTKYYKIGICCFSAKHVAFRRKSKDGLARNWDNVSKWGDMFIHGLLFQWANTIRNPAKRVDLVQADLIIISLIINLFSPWCTEKLSSCNLLWKLLNIDWLQKTNMKWFDPWVMRISEHNQRCPPAD